MGKMKDLFMEIWDERKHICEGCDTVLPHNPIPHYFSHLNSKGAEPKGKFDKRNIVLKCVECHHQWEFGKRDSILNIDKLLEKKNELKREYNESFNRKNNM